jgi:drug/metabolite transporter (DMT)-like permease
MLAISPIALALVLAAALLHALWNVRLHAASDRVAAMAVAGLVSCAGLLPAIILVPPWSAWPAIILSAAAETAYALCLSAAYQRGALAVAYPIGRGTAPLLVTLGGWVVLAQLPTPLTILGALALATGLSLIALTGYRTHQQAAIGFALLTGCTIAAYSLVDAHAVQTVSPVGYLGAVLGLQGVMLTVWVRLDVSRLRQAVKPGIQIAIGSVAAYLLVLFAFQHADAGRIATLREASVLIGLFLAGGKHSWRIWVGASLVVAGILLVTV